MGVSVLLLLAGALVLYAGAELSVRSASGLARAAGIPAFTLGALLFGIDLEGSGAAVVAAARGETPLAAGEIFGAVLFLFSAAFGAALVLAREPVPSPSPIMVVGPSLPLAVAALAIFDRHVDRLEAALLVALYAAYAFLVVRLGRREAEKRGAELRNEAARGEPRRLALLTLAGLVLLVLGATVLVAGGVRILEGTGLAAGFVGAAVLGVLVSLDEVLLEVIPVRRSVPDLATGNLFGTLAAFSTGVLGVAALMRPLDVDGAGAAAFLGMAVLYAVVAVTFLLRGRAGKVIGAFVLAAYAVWLVATAAV